MKAACILLFFFFLFQSVNAQGTTETDEPVVLHPEQEAYIKNYINRFAKNLLALKKDNKELLTFIEYVLLLRGIPRELKNLAVIESALYNKSISNAGAAGPWQFMPETAREFGLLVDSTTDERYDIYKSTFAAAKMLQRLYNRYNDWDLVITAYNCGIGHLDKAIAQSGSRSFDKLQYYLPAESRNHVKKFSGTTFILDKNIVSVPDTVRKAITGDPDSLSLSNNGMAKEYVEAGITLNSISRKLNIPLTDLKKWNAAFELQSAKDGFSWLLLPYNKVADFVFYKSEILEMAMQENIKK